ncbi:MAG: 50S ribosomal protein L22 [uncultured bacterium]|nr:MAG: 50S ribosomal protein L22 [uncultured bacterium]KKP68965.1 MAG: 50S ribosomal protein L22 [Candidatus Moranbacteria bacterium GW2011_GWE1_35_17]KKP72392.1 MAG: 50S ribosomal protein L22 [Candidatus Moranbacteria bacterium GW2011_GWE2_35_164]KKP83793.1 MAG: 50S ribosomal protein L22 [Candidatus Moranbacteria bacterium GW2011_GWF1_35_5]KKP84745.1 MAG: 50S ribosomal protein L22 [Candidatus Moranbacteria bacterium GW2011_GWF2_35_54]HBR78806.1 50S ribosomal protein L22 [Candidatus Moranbact
MKVKAKLKNLRVSPRKVRISADIVRGCNIEDAIFRLDNTVKKSNEPIKKMLLSAVANAQNNFNLDRSTLVIADIQVGEGITMKRWMPRAYGRASEILKRSAHVYITLEGQEASANPAKKKEVKSVKKDDKTEGSIETVEKVEEKKDATLKLNKKSHYRVDAKKKESREKGFNKTMFKRKSI